MIGGGAVVVQHPHLLVTLEARAHRRRLGTVDLVALLAIFLAVDDDLGRGRPLREARPGVAVRAARPDLRVGVEGVADEALTPLLDLDRSVERRAVLLVAAHAAVGDRWVGVLVSDAVAVRARGRGLDLLQVLAVQGVGEGHLDVAGDVRLRRLHRRLGVLPTTEHRHHHTGQ